MTSKGLASPPRSVGKGQTIIKQVERKKQKTNEDMMQSDDIVGKGDHGAQLDKRY